MRLGPNLRSSFRGDRKASFKEWVRATKTEKGEQAEGDRIFENLEVSRLVEKTDSAFREAE
jgi:hypothetical protein